VPRLIGRTLVNLAKTPLLIAVAIGMALVVSGIELPTPIAKTIDMTANIAPAASLLVIGAALVGLELAGLATTVAIIAFAKLIIHPLAVWGGITVMGLENPDLRNAALVFAAAPTMSMLPILAQKYGQEGPCAAALLVTTTASFFTLSAWLWLISHGWVG
jgi:predicted permease